VLLVPGIGLSELLGQLGPSWDDEDGNRNGTPAISRMNPLAAIRPNDRKATVAWVERMANPAVRAVSHELVIGLGQDSLGDVLSDAA
jgi:hypothetical protein